LQRIVADLGDQPPANAYLESIAAAAAEKRYPLRARVCDVCKLVQVDCDVPPQELFDNYAYFSSYSESWLGHARSYCEMARIRFALSKDSLVIELASNDGYLLKNFVAAGIPVIGIDPSDTVAAAAVSAGVPTLVEFFGVTLAERLASEDRKADLIIGNNVLAHVPDINDFVGGMAVALKAQGTITLEFPHLLRLIEHVEFDTIYHEHYSYISLLAVERILERQGLRVFDIEEIPTHGGSLRVFACHADRKDATESEALQKVRDDEKRAGLADLNTYSEFASQVERCRESVRNFLAEAKRDGKTVAAYGAAAKGNTLLNFCGVTSEDVCMVADRNPHKQHRLLPGTHIPIVSPEEVLSFRPDYVWILPWNLKTEIMKQLAEVRSWGGRFVTAIPHVEIIE